MTSNDTVLKYHAHSHSYKMPMNMTDPVKKGCIKISKIQSFYGLGRFSVFCRPRSFLSDGDPSLYM